MGHSDSIQLYDMFIFRVPKDASVAYGLTDSRRRHVIAQAQLKRSVSEPGIGITTASDGPVGVKSTSLLGEISHAVGDETCSCSTYSEASCAYSFIARMTSLTLIFVVRVCP